LPVRWGIGSFKVTFSAPVVRRSAGLVVLAIALLAGPLSAECSSCCPSVAERDLEIGSLGCCGGPCGVTLERPDSDRAAPNVQKSCLDLSATSLVLPSLPADIRAGELAVVSFDLPPPASLSIATPLRL
jgi:hypothetical protein